MENTVVGPQLSDYDYDLPEARIAMHPLAERDKAKMMVLDSEGTLHHSLFQNMGEFLPQNSLIVLNDTKVVHARLVFRKESGTRVEVFCLSPLAPYTEMALAMQAKGPVTWECLIGNSRKWKPGQILDMDLPNGNSLRAKLDQKNGRETIVTFSWTDTALSWAEVLETAGKIPLPPYIHRDAVADDEEQYQTIYARHQGAVAAPTAGLHFTERLIQDLSQKGIGTETLTLHVSAGTFQPVAHENAIEHPMHREQVIYQSSLIEKILSGKYTVVAAGTTSMRALESLYWFGNELEHNPDATRFFVHKLQPYQHTKTIGLQKAMQNILDWMSLNQKTELHGETEIFIFPGYIFKVCDALITNFHTPKSTLLMLVAAFVGPQWREIYQSALEKDYRFLSYGDGMLLYRSQGSGKW